MRRAWLSLTQEWWAPIGAVLAAFNAAIGIVIIADEQNPGSLIGGALFVLGGIAIVVGLLTRPRRRELGNALVVAGAFWGLPIIWLVVPAVLTIVVWIGVFKSGFKRERNRPAVA